MGFLGDFMSIMRKRDVVLIESRQEAEDVYTFTFDQPEGLSWRAGQYALFTITHAKVKAGTKPFSIASSPQEGVIRLTTRIGARPSDYKQALRSLKPGMTVKMSGPVGSFGLTGARPALLIAGGIGITPYRSILPHLAEASQPVQGPLQLLYLDSDKAFVHHDTLAELARSIPLQIVCLDERDKLEQEIGRFAKQYGDRADYLIAGPKPFVDSLTASLQQQGVAKARIKKDAFFGYS